VTDEVIEFDRRVVERLCANKRKCRAARVSVPPNLVVGLRAATHLAFKGEWNMSRAAMPGPTFRI
jgi:hypothetical protein